MKQIRLLYDLAQDDSGFMYEQYVRVHERKNILFVSPILSGRHLYRYLLPYFNLNRHNKAATAITNLEKFQAGRYEDIDVQMASRQVLWSDIIVFPFTTQPLSSLFDRIRDINPKVKIIYNIDFNYYLINEHHPLYSTINQPHVRFDIEDNIIASDTTLFGNTALMDFVIKRIGTAVEERYPGQSVKTGFQFIPPITDLSLVLENQQGHIVVDKGQMLRVGIICQSHNWSDILAFHKQLSEINEKHKGKVRFVFIGFDGVNQDGKSCIPGNIEFEHVKPCSIVHYFKEIHALNLDVIFIPLVQNAYNETSENLYRFMEAAILKIPVIAMNMPPYNQVSEVPEECYFLIKKKNDLVSIIESFINDRSVGQNKTRAAYVLIESQYSYHEANLALIDRVYS